MDINTAANIAEIGGGLAILVSLVYVGYQVRQSNRIASATALQSILDAFSTRSLTQYMEHPEKMDILIQGHHHYRQLSRHEETFFNAWINKEVFHMQNVMQFYEKGLIGKLDYLAWLAFTAAILKTPGGSECWNQMKISYSPTIVETMDKYLRDNPSAPSLIDLFPRAYELDCSDAGQT